MTEETTAPKKEDGNILQNATKAHDDKPQQKQALKYFFILVVGIIAITLWWISIPAAITWYLWKKTSLDKQKKIAGTVAVFIIFFVAFGIVKAGNKPPVLAITEPKDTYSFQASSTKIKGTVEPKESTVVIDGVAVKVNDGVFEQEVQLLNEQNTFRLVAKHGTGETSTELAIQRQFTEEEKAANQKQADENKKQQEAEDQKRKDAMKGDVESFYKQTLAIAKPADEAYAAWSKSLDSTTDAQAYLDAESVIQTMEKAQGEFSKLTPPAGLPDDEQKKIKEGLSDLSTAYYTKRSAMKSMQKYLNEQDLKALQKFKDDGQLSQSFVLSGLAKVMEITMRYGVGLQ